MKRIALFTISVLLALSSGAWARGPEPRPPERAPPEFAHVVLPFDTESNEKLCPVKDYLDTDNIEHCFKCHAEGTFKVRKVNPLNKYKLPEIAGAEMVYDNDELTLYYTLGDINDSGIRTLFHWLEWNPEIKNVIIEIQSPGGSLMNAWRIIGIIEKWKTKDPSHVVETRVNGLAASAGLLIFMAGDQRAASPTAELMWHEISVTSYGFHRSTSSNAQEQTKVLAHLQKTANAYIANRCNMTEEEFMDKIKDNKTFWINGREAKDLGIATELLWGK